VCAVGRQRRACRLWVVVGALLALVASGTAAAAEPPNVLVIVTDDQRANDTMWVMPKVRRYFSRQGVEYPNGFSVTPLCCPSRSTIFTGRYAHNTGIKGNGPPTALDTTTVVTRLLKNAGYGTALVGKFLNSWPITRQPPYFDRWALGGAPYFDPRFNENGTLKTVSGYSTSRIGRYSLRFLRHFETDDAAPWFLYVAFHAPHHPWQAEPRYANAKLRPWGGNPAVFEHDRSDKPPFFQAADYYTVDDGRRVRTPQLRTLMSVDDVVGKVFSTLRDLHERGRTLAFFLSDNGFLWADHHLGGARGTAGQKRLPYTPSVRVPFLARWARHLPAGTRDVRLTGTPDIVPTILDAAGIAPDPSKPPLDGRSLLEPDARDRILFEYWHERGWRWIPTWASLRTTRYQFIEYYGTDDSTVTFREYYRLKRDPWQLVNVLRDGNPANDPDVAALSAQLAADRACEGLGPGPGACP
jgi:arylsulfatase A-like enzyme